MPDAVDLAGLVARLDRLTVTDRPALIAVDGIGGSGKSTLAAAVAARLDGTAVVPLDDFIVKAHMLDDSWERSWDRDRLVRQVLAPLRRGETATYERLDWVADALVPGGTIERAARVMVEGITTLHPTLRRYWDCAIWVETPADLARERGRQRDAGNENEQHWGLWSANDARYRAEHDPQAAADLVVAGMGA